MSFTAPKSFDYEKHPAGTFAARCYQVVDLGTHYNDRWAKSSHLVRIVFETTKKMKDGRPFSINIKVTLSMHEKATLRKYLESWRGKAFTSAEADNFDLEKLIGKCALLTITHSEDGEFANITGVSMMPEGMPEPQAVNEPICYVIGSSSEETFKRLTAKTQELILKSEELTGTKREPTPAHMNGEQPPVSDFDTDDIPF